MNYAATRCRSANALKYRNAGTVEFLQDDAHRQFYFIE